MGNLQTRALIIYLIFFYGSATYKFSKILGEIFE